MAENEILEVRIFDQELGKLGYDIDKRTSFFQYDPDFLESGRYTNLFPYLLKRIKPIQVFNRYQGETFRGLPPMIADSLPDMFGNIIFKKWFEAKNKQFQKITPLEQLTYVANRGMGALEYRPVAEMPKTSTINLEEILDVLQEVLQQKEGVSEKYLNSIALLNIFKMGTSAGGARPKILVSEHKKTGAIIPGDIEFSDSYNHYLVKLSLNQDKESDYNREKVEYAYYLMAQQAGIHMMFSKLIDNKHFATLRYDRQNGEKIHVLTTSGLTGWDFKKPENSSYENLFSLAIDLKVSYKEIQELFRRMVFNICFANIDDHLKNHSFMYSKEKNQWSLAPAYDLTYPLDINFNYINISRALSVNNKRNNISLNDILILAEKFTIKDPKTIINEVQTAGDQWRKITSDLDMPERVAKEIEKEFVRFV